MPSRPTTSSSCAPLNIASETNHRDESRGLTREGVSMQGISEAAERVNGGSVFNFELKDLEVIEISYTFALWNKTRRICQGVQERKAKRASIM